MRRTVRTRLPVDFRLTLGPLAEGGSPCVRVRSSEVWWATTAPTGPATLHLQHGRDREVLAEAWGPGADHVLERVPDLVGAADDSPDLAAGHPVVTEMARRLPGLRIGRTGAVFEALLPTVISQKVIGAEARAAFRAIVRAAGRRAPGPVPLFLPPTPEWIAALPSWAFHRFGVEHRRARTAKVAAGYAHRLEESAHLGLPEARRRLGALPGIGPWTVNVVAMTALGDPDAVSVGDYWLCHYVTYALTGERRGTDERMLELLEPWRGQRGRVCRLLMAGAAKPPRHGPRLALRAIAGS